MIFHPKTGKVWKRNKLWYSMFASNVLFNTFPIGIVFWPVSDYQVSARRPVPVLVFRLGGPWPVSGIRFQLHLKSRWTPLRAPTPRSLPRSEDAISVVSAGNWRRSNCFNFCWKASPNCSDKVADHFAQVWTPSDLTWCILHWIFGFHAKRMFNT